jgi:hypothetical protein
MFTATAADLDHGNESTSIGMPPGVVSTFNWPNALKLCDLSAPYTDHAI